MEALLAPALVGAGAGIFALAAFERLMKDTTTIRDLIRPRDLRRGRERLQALALSWFGAELIEERLERAGRPWSLPVAGWALVRLAALPAGALLCLGAGIAPNVALPMGLAMGWFGPDFVLTQLIDNRNRRMRARVPHVADLTATVLTAGAPDVAIALERVLDKRHEFDQLLQNALREADAVGFEAALAKAASRAGGEEGRQFCGVLAQARKLGAAKAGENLHAQAKQIHTLQAHARKAHAERSKTYLLLITVIFFFVPVFLVALLPAWGTLSRFFSM